MYIYTVLKIHLSNEKKEFLFEIKIRKKMNKRWRIRIREKRNIERNSIELISSQVALYEESKYREMK